MFHAFTSFVFAVFPYSINGKFIVPCYQVLIWDVETQNNRHAVLGATPSRPDLVCYYFRLVCSHQFDSHIVRIDILSRSPNYEVSLLSFRY